MNEPRKKQTKGEYVIWEEDGEIWSTDSIFWKNFFKGGKNDIP